MVVSVWMRGYISGFCILRYARIHYSVALEFQITKFLALVSCSHQMANHNFVSQVKGTPPTPNPVHNVAENAEDTSKGDGSLGERDLPISELDDSDKVISTSDKRTKKSLFEITSVVNTENDFSRGESMGNDVEDSELDDTLSETPEASTPNEPAPDVSSKNATNHHGQSSATSRFRIVKITRPEPYKKGRWTCHEFSDSPPENKGERKQGMNAADPLKPTNGTSGQSNKPHMGARLKDNSTTDSSNSTNTEIVADSTVKHGQRCEQSTNAAPLPLAESGRTTSNQKLTGLGQDSSCIHSNISQTINSRTLPSNTDESFSAIVSESTPPGISDRAPSRTGEPRSRSSSCQRYPLSLIFLLCRCFHVLSVQY